MRRIFGVVLAGLVALATIGSTAAQDQGSAIVTIETSGVLVATISDASFGALPYSFVDQTATASVVVNAQDNTGSGAGWNITLYGTDFIRDVNTSFPASNLVLADGTAVSTSGQASTGMAVPGLTLGTIAPGQKVASAPVLAGMGHYTITYPGTLTVPGGTLVGQYKSTLTVSITSGP